MDTHATYTSGNRKVKQYENNPSLSGKDCVEIYDEFYTSCDGEHRAMLDKYIANAGTLKYAGDESAKELAIKFLYEFGGAKWIIKPVYETVSKASVEFDGEAAHFMSADLYAERGYAK